MVRPTIPRERQREFWRLIRSGVRSERSAAIVGVSPQTGKSWFRDAGGMPPMQLETSGRALSFAERSVIEMGLGKGYSNAEIARQLDRDRSTIGREITRHRAGDGRYRATVAQARADTAACRPKPGKLATNERLRGYVEDKLGGEEHWSPKQVSLMLPREFPDDEAMRISPETIYQSLFVQARGQLKVGLTSSLRTGRAVRKPRGLSDGRGRIKDMVSISERPAEVADRAVPGHWEGDLIMGKNGKSAVGTLVERTTRYVILLHLPGSKDPVAVRDAIVAAMLTLPAQLRKSLTWDRGMELNRHADLKIQAGLDVYFCDPASPWQRGSNENTNGLLRQYLPKGTDLSVHSADDLARIAAALNRRPRETLGMKRPVEALTELISEHQQTTGVATTT